MRIAPGRFVTLTYRLTRRDGRVLEQHLTDEALCVCHGSGQLPTWLETLLQGRRAGDRLVVELAPEEACGRRHPGATRWVPRSAWKGRGPPSPGAAVRLETTDGRQAIGWVTAARADRIAVDLDDPLAGEPLRLTVRIHGVAREPPELATSRPCRPTWR